MQKWSSRGVGAEAATKSKLLLDKKRGKIALLEDFKTKGEGKQSFFGNNSILWPIIKTYG